VAEGFKIASAYVEVHLQDNTQAEERALRARLEKGGPIHIKTVLDDPEGLEKVKERVRNSSPAKLPVEAANPIDAAWRSKIQASLKDTANEALKIPVSPGTERFRRDLAAVIQEVEKGLKADIPAGVKDAAQFKAEVQLLAAMAAEEVQVRIPVDVDTDPAEQAIDRFTSRTKAKFSALSFAALSLGLPAAAAIGAAGAVAALAVVPLVFTSIAAIALASNDQIRATYRQLGTDVVSSTRSMATVMQGPLLGAADDLRASFNRMRPEIQAAFTGTAPLVRDLTGSVTDLAENAMPGMVVAIEQGAGALQGFRAFTGDVGSGLSDMFRNLASESDAAGQSMAIFGNISRDLLGFVGGLLANLSAGAAGPLTQFRGALAQVEDAALSLTSNGMPLLSGITSGFLGTVSGGVAIVQAMASALGSWAGPLGSLGGSLLATNQLAKLFGTSLGDTGFGLRAFTTSIDDAGRRTTPFKQALADADSSGSSKFRAGLTSLVSGGINPLGIALMAGGLLLDIWGQNAQRAAAAAAEQKGAINDLTAAYERDNGVVGDNVRATTGKVLADKNAYNSNKLLGLSMTDVTAAGLGQGTALDTLNGRFRTYLTGLVQANQIGGDVTPMVMRMADAYVQQGGSVDAVVNKMTASRMATLNLNDAQKEQLKTLLQNVRAVNQEADANDAAAAAQKRQKDATDMLSSTIARGLTPAAYGAQAASNDLAAAFETLNKAGGDATAKAQALVDVMDTLSGRSLGPEDALQKWNDHMRLAADAFAKVKEQAKDFPPNMIAASGAIDTVSQAGSQLKTVVQQAKGDMAAYAQSLKDSGMSAQEITPKLTGMRDEFAKHLKTLGLNDEQIQKIIEHYGMIPEDIVTALKLEGDKESQAQINRIIEDLASVPDEKGVHVTALTDAAIKALGDLGYTIVKMPNGQFQVFANTDPGRTAAKDLMNEVGNMDATTSVYANTAPAGQQVMDWKAFTSSVSGNTTTYTSADPAGRSVAQWKVTTDATGARTTTYSNIDIATGAVRVWKQNADGTWAETHASADVAAAEAALNNAARNRTSTITVYTVGRSGNSGSSNQPGLAHGGLSGYATGGKTRLPGYASGSLVDATKGGLLSGPGTPTSDDILTMFSNGFGRTSDEEFVINAEQTRKWYPLLVAINGGMRGFANGGKVQAEDGSWVPESFYGPAPKGSHAIYTESGFAKVRASAMANGIGSLSALDQSQLRTYGGWVDTPVSPVAPVAPAGAGSAVATLPAASIAAGGEMARTIHQLVKASSGRTANITININGVQQPDQLLAAQVANEVAWRLK
jgi:hypothetical protein